MIRYQAAYNVVLGTGHLQGRHLALDAQEELDTEMSKPELVAQVDFQAAILRFLEECDELPANYDSLLKAIED